MRLKLCLVFVVLGACSGANLQTADTWAQRVCRLVLAFPVASESALPPGVVINVQVTPSVAVAVVSALPDAGTDVSPAASAIALPGPPDGDSEQ